MKRLRGNAFSSIIRQETAFFDKNRTGELINRLSADTTVVANSLTQNISDGLRAGVTVLASTGMMVHRLFTYYLYLCYSFKRLLLCMSSNYYNNTKSVLLMYSMLEVVFQWWA